MFFILSKTVALLFMPLSIVLITLALSFVVKPVKFRKYLRILSLVLLMFFSNKGLINSIFKAWEVETIPFEKLGKYDVGIVLAGIVLKKDNPDDRVYFQKGADRIIHASQLYHQGKINKILISGGSGNLLDQELKESSLLGRYLESRNIPPEDIWIEIESRNTYENAVQTKKILDRDFGKGKYLLITSAFHMRRAQACFEKLGMEVSPFSTDFYAEKANIAAYFSFSAFSLMKWTILIKEWLGYLAYWAAGYV